MDAFETDTELGLVIEYISGQDLYEYAVNSKKVNELEVCLIFKDLIAGVLWLHQHQICHRDLKIENILLDKLMTAKLIDFGLATRYTPGVKLTERCGSAEYCAPEIILAKAYDPEKTDVWALGVILVG